MPYLLFIIIFSIFLLLKILQLIQHLFQMIFLLKRYALTFLKGTGTVLLSVHYFNSLGLCHELCVVQGRCMQSILVKRLQISNVWHAWMMQTVLKSVEDRLEVSFTYGIIKINKWMWMTVHSKHI